MIEVRPSKAQGSVRAPPSKSYSHRALAVSLLCEGPSRVRNISRARDVIATLNAIRSFGAKISDEFTEIKIEPPQRPSVPDDVIYCGGSGTTIRFFVPISTLTEGGYTVLTGNDSLRRRPMGPIIDAINKLGGWAISSRMNGLPPLIVRGGGLKGGEVEIDGSISSQFFSGLMIASTRFESGLKMRPIGELVSRPYLEMTEEVLRRSGSRVELDEEIIVEPVPPKSLEFEVPGDYGLAAFHMLAASVTGGRVIVEGLDNTVPQADYTVIDVLKSFGVEVREVGSSVIVEGKPRYGARLNLKDSPDIFPIACVLASFVSEVSEIRGVAHARVKESDRVASMSSELEKVGVEVRELYDGLIIRGGNPKGGVKLDSHGDHRIFMALLALAAATREGCIIEGEESVADSYPGFLEDSIKLGIDLRPIGFNTTLTGLSGRDSLS